MQWQNSVIADLKEKQPDLVFIANHSEAERIVASDEYEAGLETLITELQPLDTAIIEDIQILPLDPISCLARHVESVDTCIVQPQQPANSADRQVAAKLGIPFVEVRQWLCSDTSCPLIQGNVLLYRDSNHITATFSRLFAPNFRLVVENELQQSGTS